MIQRWLLTGGLCLLIAAQAVSADSDAQRQTIAARSVVSSVVKGLVDRDPAAVRGGCHLPAVVTLSVAGAPSATVAVLRSEGVGEEVAGFPDVPDGARLAEQAATELAVTLLGDRVAVGVLHQRPRPGAETGPGCAALLGQAADGAWRVACLLIGPAVAPAPEQVEPITATLTGFWQALLTHDIALMRRVARLPYLDVGQDERAADVQLITDTLLEHYSSPSRAVDSEAELLDTGHLIRDVQVRLFGPAAALALYSSAFDGLPSGPSECAMLTRDTQGAWRIVATGSD